MTRPVDALFPDAAAAKRAGLCPRCGEAVDPDGFTDAMSKAEWRITGMCEGCQTIVYQALADMEDAE